jgi:hypothetical protein
VAFTRIPTLAGAQRGTVLIVALVLLVVLTLLGVSALNTTTIEEKMAANIQEVHRAFHAAETGLDVAFSDPDTFSLTDTVPGQTELLEPYNAGANFEVEFLRATNPPVGSLYSATSFSAYHFDMLSQAGSNVTDEGDVFEPSLRAARVTLHGGAYQIGPKVK